MPDPQPWETPVDPSSITTTPDVSPPTPTAAWTTPPPVSPQTQTDLANYAQPGGGAPYQPPGSIAAPAPPQPEPQTGQPETPPGMQQPYTVPEFRGGPVKQALTRMLYGFGQAAMHHVGLPTDYDIQQSNYKQALDTAQLQVSQQHQQLLQRAQQYAETQMTMRDPSTGQFITGAPAQVTALLRRNAANLGKVDVANIGAQAKRDVAQLQYGPGIPLDPVTANLAGVPDLANKPVGQGELKAINMQLQARGYKFQDLGSEGMWLVDRAGNKIKQMGPSPGVSRAVAGAQARAMYSPYETVDENNTPYTISAYEAVRTGAPGIGKPNLMAATQPAALIGDIRGSVKQVRGLTDVLDNASDRVQIAAILADPNGTVAKLAQSGLLSNLSSDRARDYVIAATNLNEQAMALRSALRAGTGSEDVRQAIRKTIPNAATPGSAYANKQLDSVEGVLSRVEKGLPNLPPTQNILGGGGGASSAPPKNAKIRDYRTLGTNK